MTEDVLQRLAALISARRAESASKSYTRELLDGGPERCAKKLGEEATETIIAAVGQDNRALTREAADLVYHLLVLLESKRNMDELAANPRLQTFQHECILEQGSLWNAGFHILLPITHHSSMFFVLACSCSIARHSC